MTEKLVILVIWLLRNFVEKVPILRIYVFVKVNEDFKIDDEFLSGLFVFANTVLASDLKIFYSKKYE